MAVEPNNRKRVDSVHAKTYNTGSDFSKAEAAKFHKLGAPAAIARRPIGWRERRQSLDVLWADGDRGYLERALNKRSTRMRIVRDERRP